MYVIDFVLKFHYRSWHCFREIEKEKKTYLASKRLMPPTAFPPPPSLSRSPPALLPPLTFLPSLNHSLVNPANI